jgi:hypothetical protein
MFAYLQQPTDGALLGGSQEIPAGSTKKKMADMQKAVKDGSIKKQTMADLKAYLKKHGQTQAGEKEDLILRITLHVRSAGLDVGDGKNPFDLQPAELRKACAQRGLNPVFFIHV